VVPSTETLRTLDKTAGLSVPCTTTPGCMANSIQHSLPYSMEQLAIFRTLAFVHWAGEIPRQAGPFWEVCSIAKDVAKSTGLCRPQNGFGYPSTESEAR
jgi:hypothetical protein